MLKGSGSSGDAICSLCGNVYHQRERYWQVIGYTSWCLQSKQFQQHRKTGREGGENGPLQGSDTNSTPGKLLAQTTWSYSAAS